MVIRKVLKPPALFDFAVLMATARREARKPGVARADVTNAVAKVRCGK